MKDTYEYTDGQYVLSPLPYAPNALEPLIDAETVKLHYGKHHAAYVAGANAAAKALREIAEGKKDASLTPFYTRQLAFNEAGNALHRLYWDSMNPTPKLNFRGELTEAIQKKFGSFDGMMLIFRNVAASVQGSGWALLGFEPVSRELMICGVEKHQCELVPGFIPLLACDVWEHAYYLKYRNNRAEYIEAFTKLIDWEKAEARYIDVLSHF